MKQKIFLVFFVIWIFTAGAFGASVILNEYNPVGGTLTLRDNGWDTYWGLQDVGNGGDWFELVVIEDHLDMRNWSLKVDYVGSNGPDTLNLTDNDIWSDLRSGTIITVSEDLADDVSYDPFGGDWWINVNASSSGTGAYIEAQNFPVDDDDWILTIKDDSNVIVFGPAGEDIYAASNISNTEICRLEENPSASITPLSDYDDGNMSTFGSPNVWGSNVQDFSSLRSVVPEPMTVSFLAVGLIFSRRRKI